MSKNKSHIKKSKKSKKSSVIDPQSFSYLVNFGNDYVSKGEFDLAIEQYNKALAINPKHAGILANLGNSYVGKGEFDLAIEQYNKVLAIDPNYVDVLVNLGSAYAEKDEFDLAIEQYNKALAIDPKHIHALFNLGNAYAREGEFDLAIEQQNKALAIDPKHIHALVNLGNAYTEKDEFDLAIEQYNKALAIDPKYINTLINLGNVYARNGKFNLAIEQYNKALAIDPKHIHALFNLGNAYAEKDEFDLAIEQYNKVLAIDTKHFDTLANLGRSYACKGEFDLAIETYVNCIKYTSYDENYLSINEEVMIKIEEIEEKKAAVKLIENKKDKQHFANSIDEVIEIVIQLRNESDSLFFRGQNDFRWKISSTHERVKGTLMCLNEKLTQFKISIQALLNIEDKLDDGNYYALMQHYGIHTPLIDFSEFLNTALYFAVTDSNLKTTNSIPCVWVLIAKNNQKVSLSELDELDELDEKYEEYRNKILYPNLKDKRIRAQNGVFVWSDNEKPLNENKNFELHQIIIFDEHKNDALVLNQKIRDTLELSSTSATKIYPDDKGLAYEINYQSKGITSKHNINAFPLKMINNSKSDLISAP